MIETLPIDITDVKAAAGVIAGIANKTPLLQNDDLNQQAGAQVWYKCENQQQTGSFKFRGAYYELTQLSDEQKKRGAVTYSSGNHGKALSVAGKRLGVPVVIVIPDDVPAAKMKTAQENGAEIITYDRHNDDREAMAEKLATDRGLTLLPPYNHPDVMAGQGTVALEMLEQEPELDCLVVPIGGGGLISGMAITAKALKPNIKIIGVEPQLANDAYQSLAAGKIVHIDPPDTIADGIRTLELGSLTFPVIQRLVDEIVTVSEQQIKEATVYAQTTLGQTIEPTAAVTLAAVLAHKIPGRRIGILFSGGNVDQVLIEQLKKELV